MDGRAWRFQSLLKCLEQVRSKTPTPYTAAPIIETLPSRSRTPLPNTHPQMDPAPAVTARGFVPDSVYTFDRQTGLSRSSRDIRPTNVPPSRSKTPGPEFESTFSSSSYRASAIQPRSKTPTAADYSSSTLHNRWDILSACRIFSTNADLSRLVDHYPWCSRTISNWWWI